MQKFNIVLERTYKYRRQEVVLANSQKEADELANNLVNWEEFEKQVIKNAPLWINDDATARKLTHQRINITDKAQFNEAVQFAKKLGGDAKKSFIRCIETLNALKNNTYSEYTLHIYPDSVNHSLGWHFSGVDSEGHTHACDKNGNYKRGMNGGMILHGFQQTFAVQLETTSYPRWSIHT